MTTPQQNTKIESLVEAIETFSINIARGVTAPRYADAKLLHRERVEAREEMAKALREFLQPSFRVITEQENRLGEMAVVTRKTVEPVDAIATKTFTVTKP